MYKSLHSLLENCACLSYKYTRARFAHAFPGGRSSFARAVQIISPFIFVDKLYSTTMSEVKNLAVFDFDLTVASKNTDTEVIKLIKNDVPQEVKEIYQSQGWTAFMGEVFNILHAQNCSKSEIYDVICNIPETNGMTSLLNALFKELNYDIIIISDSNMVFIKDWLEAHKLNMLIDEIFTNPAYYNNSDKLVIEPYQDQNACDECSRNLCKGTVMKKYIEMKAKQGIHYSKVIYAGDGTNDFCPMLKLNKTDIAFPRIGYKCLDKIEKCKDYPECSIKAMVHPWNDAHDILKFLKE